MEGLFVVLKWLAYVIAASIGSIIVISILGIVAVIAIVRLMSRR